MSTIITSFSPLADLAAEVITENSCSHLYLYQIQAAQEPASEQTLRTLTTCWIKNHVIVDDDYSPADDMMAGLQPRVKTRFCNYQEDLALLNEENLELVWGKEGYMISLFENDELLCVIPYWANEEFTGYSKYSATSEVHMLPFPLGNAEINAIFGRCENDRAFWNQDFGKVWEEYQTGYFAELEHNYGTYVNYYAIDGGAFPPKGLAVFQKEDTKYAFTIGLGMFAQPKVDMYHEDIQSVEKFELGICYQAGRLDEMKVFSQISAIANVPWAYGTFLAHHHTVDLNVDQQYHNAVLVSDVQAKTGSFEFLKKNLVNLLWLVPVTDDIYEKLTDEENPDYSLIELRAAEQDIAFR